jgi:hypothetical protein
VHCSLRLTWRSSATWTRASLVSVEREHQQVHLWFFYHSQRDLKLGQFGPVRWAITGPNRWHGRKTEAHHNFLPPAWQPSGISRSWSISHHHQDCFLHPKCQAKPYPPSVSLLHSPHLVDFPVASLQFWQFINGWCPIGATTHQSSKSKPNDIIQRRKKKRKGSKLFTALFKQIHPYSVIHMYHFFGSSSIVASVFFF